MSDKNEFPISDSTFLLSSFGIFAACFGTFLSFILKSRCTQISCFGIRIIRDVIPAADVVQMQNLERGQIQAEESVVRT